MAALYRPLPSPAKVGGGDVCLTSSSRKLASFRITRKDPLVSSASLRRMNVSAERLITEHRIRSFLRVAMVACTSPGSQVDRLLAM
jgi:hypothetical protein